jgi:hypoxanthine phosphoribosyltransferase
MKATIQIHDRKFAEIISYEKIVHRIKQISDEISLEYKNLTPVFLPVLNGSFMFAADLMKAFQFPAEIEFVNAKSYQGTTSSGKVLVETYFKQPVKGKHLIVVEDIVDTGLTMQKLIAKLKEEEPASIAIITLLDKPEAHQVPVDIKITGFPIKNEFVVGYGLDYDGLGRNLLGIFQEVI